MDKTAQPIQPLAPSANTRIIAPYATTIKNTIVYRAWYGACQINYHTDNHTITLYDDDNERTIHPIVSANDRYRNKLVAIFELPNNDDTPRERPFLRVEIVQYRPVHLIDTQGPIFITSELYEPEL